MEDIKKRNVARKISMEEMQSHDGPVYYIPHHAVQAKLSIYTASNSI